MLFVTTKKKKCNENYKKNHHAIEFGILKPEMLFIRTENQAKQNENETKTANG